MAPNFSFVINSLVRTCRQNTDLFQTIRNFYTAKSFPVSHILSHVITQRLPPKDFQSIPKKPPKPESPPMELIGTKAKFR